MKLPQSIIEINNFFSSNSNNIGSFERVVNFYNNFKYRKDIDYLIAGSWAIEGISGQKMNHDDIDLVILNNLSYYVDDAITKEEHCCNVIPLPSKYIAENAVKIKLRNSLEIKVPHLTLQFCLKLIGQLEKDLPQQAISQTYALLSLYQYFSYDAIREEIIFLLEKLTPADFHTREVAEKMASAIRSYEKRDLRDTERKLRESHKVINDSLHKKFREMGLE